MRIITKKSYPDLFEKVLAGEKTFDMRVADFDIQPGDILEQIEVNYDGTPTGRSLAELNNEEWQEYLAAIETVDGFVMLRDYLKGET